MSTGWRCRGMTWTGGSGEYKARTICAANWAGRESGYFDGMCLQMQAAEPDVVQLWGAFGLKVGCTENNHNHQWCGGLYRFLSLHARLSHVQKLLLVDFNW